MKKQIIFRIFPVTLALLILGSVVLAQQSPTAADKEKAAMEAEMKAKQELLEFQQQQMKEQQLKTMEIERAYADQARARSSSRVYSSGSSDEGPYFFVSGSQENQSQLTLRNSFNGNSDTSQGEFDVDENTTYIRCTINGKVRSGIINIKVLYPGGKVFKDLSITSSAEISFSQSFSIKEEDVKKYAGSWNYQVTADKAEGNYVLSIMTH
jgi:hypothetical protein